MEEAGVWDEHARVELRPEEGFRLSAAGEALASVNGERVQEVLLRNGDVVELGSLKLQFWLSEARQPRWSVREGLGWLVVGGVLLLELVLLYGLLFGLDVPSRFF